MREVKMPMQSMMVNGVYRFATLWRIERADAVVFRFTDHDVEITYEGEVYTPTNGSVTATAAQRKSGTEAPNMDIRGAITADAITEDDLRAGKYRGAVIIEIVIDWARPWAGKYSINRFDALETTNDAGEVWSAKLAGIIGRLKRRVGHTYTRGCRWARLGDDDCGVATGPLSIVGAVTAVLTPRLKFQSDVASVDAYFDDGYIEWGSGLNLGLKHEVKYFVAADGEVELQIKTPYAIEVGDAFLIVPGCDMTIETCKDKFNNVVNFGGYPFIPGTDSMMSTPNKNK